MKNLIRVLSLIPILLLIIYLDEGAITLQGLNHWAVHIAACILVCETFHAWWHK